MKKLYFWLSILIMLAIICWLLVWHHNSAIAPYQSSTSNSVASQMHPVLRTSQNRQTASQNLMQTLAQSTNTSIIDSNKPHTIEEWLEREYSQSISFYGKVVDQDGTSVQGATASFEWANAKGDEQNASSVSDALGLFSLENRKGYKLFVSVGKTGYYAREKMVVIAYGDESGRATFKADSTNPIVFHLRKKGVGVDLITSQFGMSPDFPIHISRDGTPIKVDFLHRSTGDSGQMQINEIKPEYSNWKQATNWSFRMEIPGGGFVEENDEFPFEAPDEGYQPVLEFNFQGGQPDWTTDIRKDYYIKFGNPPLYGRLHLETSIDMSGARLTYAINPDGSQNLEPK